MTSTPPEGFRYHTPMTVRYGDMDTLGHVNNAKYLTYIEQARISYCRDLGLWDGSISTVGLIVAKITMEYKLPLTVEDGTLDIWTRISRLGTKSFDLENLIVCQRDGQSATAAVGQVVMVVFDYQANQTAPIPSGWRELIRNYEPLLQN